MAIRETARTIFNDPLKPFDRLNDQVGQRVEQVQDTVSRMVPDELEIGVEVPIPLHPDAGSLIDKIRNIKWENAPEVFRETKDSFKQVWNSILHDNPFVKTGKTVPYPVVPEADKAAARARATVSAVRQPLISSSKDAQNPSYHEPVGLIVKATRAQLFNALQEAGWVKADEQSFWNNLKMGLSSGTRLTNYPQGPVSDMYLNGERHLVAFNKNVDSNNTRDHLRIWPMGKDQWAIAATRDTASIAWIDVDVKLSRDGWKPNLDIEPSFRSSHLIDPKLDGERDLVLTDLLLTGRVKGWEMVPGKRTSAEEEAMKKHRYETDGHVYLVDLTGQRRQNTK